MAAAHRGPRCFSLLQDTLWDTLNAKEALSQLVSADSTVVIAKCFPPGLSWGGQAREHP